MGIHRIDTKLKCLESSTDTHVTTWETLMRSAAQDGGAAQLCDDQGAWARGRGFIYIPMYVIYTHVYLYKHDLHCCVAEINATL